MEFLRTLTGPARLCFVMAFLSILFSFYASLPMSTYPNYFTLCALFTGLVSWAMGFMSTVGFHLVMRKYDKSLLPKITLPTLYWQLFWSALVYYLLVFLGTAIYYPHVADFGSAVSLRIASAFSLFFSITALVMTQLAGLKFRALQSALTTQSR